MSNELRDYSAENLDDLIGLPAAGRVINVSPESLWRWVSKGTPTPDGGRVKLKAVRVGVRWKTSLRWLHDFIDASTAAHLTRPEIPAPRTPSAAARASDAADAELQRMGA